MKMKLLLLGLLGLSALATVASPASAFFGLGCRGSNRYATYIVCRPYNAFTPLCTGNLFCDGCCPMQGCGLMNQCCPAPCCPAPCPAPCPPTCDPCPPAACAMMPYGQQHMAYGYGYMPYYYPQQQAPVQPDQNQMAAAQAAQMAAVQYQMSLLANYYQQQNVVPVGYYPNYQNYYTPYYYPGYYYPTQYNGQMPNMGYYGR